MLPLQYNAQLIEAGCDEAGRGCMAGPVFAAAVILPQHFNSPLLNDSKQLNEQQRYELRTFIEAHALAFGVAKISVAEIDKTNILKAAIKAMHVALSKLNIIPEHIIVDGNKFIPYEFIPFTTIIDGDAKFANIAAASILAKTYRDDYMLQLHKKFPSYGWDTNKGYGTATHKKAMENLGLSPHHRKTFKFKN
jgi:ribonuclease HII